MTLSGITRRDFIQHGTAAVLTACSPVSAARPSFANSLIFIWLDGGPSHLDTFDPKPDAPSETRSEFRPIRTSAPEIRISELLPRLARQMNRCALIRTLFHSAASHESACHQMLTGRHAEPNLVFPSIGAIIARERPAANRAISYVSVPNDTFGFGFGRGGCLAGQTEPACGITTMKESHRIGEAYGTHAFGRSCLRARLLVESGARCVAVSFGGWDTHCDNATACRDRLVPELDQGLAALLEDLGQSGLLDETLVVCLGEFGRSPRLNALGGRDHWPGCGSALFAGAGVPGGQVIGASDSIGAEPVDRPVTPKEIAATVYAKLGIDTNRSYSTPQHGPIRILERTNPIPELF